MNALVTGANGFTGSYLTKLLLEKGYNVKALVRKNANLDMLHDLPIEFLYKDLATDAFDASDFQGIDIVYHVAAAFRVENVPEKYFWDVNVEGTRKLLHAASEAKVKRFVHCSTVGVQGEIKSPPAKESDAYNPGDYYQKSKVDGEQLVKAFSQQSSMELTIVRPVGIYGPGDMRFYKLFKTINNQKFKMIGNGKVLYHLTFVEDLAEGIRLAGEHPAAVGETFTIGGDGFITLQQFVETIARILDKPLSKLRIPVWPVWSAGLLCELLFKPLGKTPPIYRRRVEFFVKDRAFDTTKAKTLLGFEPKTSVEDGLRITAEWYQKQGLL